jgi:hypothetical protein
VTNEHSTDTQRSIEKLRSIPFPNFVYRPSGRKYTNPKRQFAVVITIILALRNLRCLLKFWKICVSLFSSHLIFDPDMPFLVHAHQKSYISTSSRWCCHKSRRSAPTRVPRTIVLARSQVVNIPLNRQRRVFVICDVSSNYDRHYTDLHSSAMEVLPPHTTKLSSCESPPLILTMTDRWYPTAVVYSLSATPCMKYKIFATSLAYLKFQKLSSTHMYFLLSCKANSSV